MKKYILQSLVLVFVVLAIASCKKTVEINSTALNTIPDDVATVVSVNVPSLMEKADFEAVQKMEFYLDMVDKAHRENPALAQILSEPESSGIDLEKSAYFFSKWGFGGFVVELADLSKFETMLKESRMGEIENKGEYQLMVNEAYTVYAAWDNEKAVIGVPSDGVDEKGIESIFSTTKENTITKNTNLAKCFKKQHDIATWTTTNPIADQIPAAADEWLRLIGISKDALTDNYTHAYVDFENGLINSSTSYNMKKELTKDLDLMFKDEVTTDFSPYLPQEGLGGMMTVAFNPKGPNEFVKGKMLLNMMVTASVSEAGFSLGDFGRAFGGDVALGFYKNEKEETPNMIFATNILSRSSVNKFLEIGVEKENLRKEGENWYAVKTDGFDVNINGTINGMQAEKIKPKLNRSAKLYVSDDMLFISDRIDILKQIEQGGYAKSDRVSNEMTSKSKSDLFSMYLDFESLGIDSLSAEYLNEMEMSTNRKTGSFELKMKDENTNSLKQAMQLINAQHIREKNNPKPKKDPIEEMGGVELQEI